MQQGLRGGRTTMSIKAMKKIALVLVLGLLTGVTVLANPIGIPGQPKPENCVSQSEMQEIAGHFKQFRNLANSDYCFDGSQTSNLISAIMFMRRTQYPSSMPKSQDELFSGRFASNWYNYFIGRIDTFNIPNSCPKGVVAYVYSFGGKTMYVCPMGLTDIFSSLDRASVFMHEARHIDGYPHMTCSHGPRKGLNGACDDQISNGGSYAVTVETYAQLAQYAQDIHPALKAYSQSSAVVYADEAFESPVKIGRANQLLVATEGLDFYSVDLNTLKAEKMGKLSSAGKIVKRGAHMVLFPTDRTKAAKYVFANDEGEVQQSPGEIITEYNEQTLEQKSNFVDLHISAQWTARVYKNLVRFACDPNSPSLKDVAIPSGVTPANLMYPTGYARDMYTVQLAMTDGSIYDIGCSNRSAFVRSSSVKLDQNYKRMYKVGDKVFGLSSAGQLFLVNGNSSTAVLSELGAVIEISPRQSYQFFNK